MFGTKKPQAGAGSTSAFVSPSERSGSDIWAEAGNAIELAYRPPAPVGQAIRVAVAVLRATAGKLRPAGAWR
jgi:hypothetical protein